MKYAILADIHGNLEALETVIEDSKKQKVDKYVCVGDIVGYNSNPVECLDIIRELVGDDSVRGNHDHYCSCEDRLDGFHPLAADVVCWTREQLSDEQKDYLRNRPYKKRVSNFTVVHSTLDMPEKWGYVFDKLEADANFAYQRTTVCFFGHTHVPLAFDKASDVQQGLYSKFKVTFGKKYFINVGSVGQPRDGDPRAAYVIYDMGTNTIELRRLEYDLYTTQKKIIDAGLPKRLAVRLEAGR